MDLAVEHRPDASPNVVQRDRLHLENSAGVDAKSAAEKGSLGDTTFHPSSAFALLIVWTMRNLPSKVYHDVARQNPSNLASVHNGLNLFALSRIGSRSHTRSPKPANGVPNLRTFNRLNGVSPSAPKPSIHFASKRASCGSPLPFNETAATNVMPVRLSFATNSGVESPLR